MTSAADNVFPIVLAVLSVVLLLAISGWKLFKVVDGKNLFGVKWRAIRSVDTPRITIRESGCVDNKPEKQKSKYG